MSRQMRGVLSVVLVCAAVFAISGCRPPGGYEFEGTWSLPLNAATWDFGSNGGSYNLAGSYDLSFTYTLVDEGSTHILGSLTAASGPLLPGGFLSGVPIFITYRISGSSLYADFSITGYPVTAIAGPYTKQ